MKIQIKIHRQIQICQQIQKNPFGAFFKPLLLPAVTKKHDFIPNITNTITKNIYNTYKKLKSKYKF